jgi:hypothetical protein
VHTNIAIQARASHQSAIARYERKVGKGVGPVVVEDFAEYVVREGAHPKD